MAYHSDSEEKKQAVLMLLAAYQVEPSAVMIQAWAIGLQDITAEQVERATTRILQGDYPHLPRPGEFRSIALGGVRTNDEEAELAWAALGKALDRCDTGPLDNRIKTCVDQMGGGSYLIGLSRKECDFRRAQFIRLFNAAAKTVSAPALEDKTINQQSLAGLAGVTLGLKDGSKIKVRKQ